MVEKQEQADASVQHVEDVMIDYYRETVGQKDTVGMASYMKEHLNLEDYQLWLKMGDSSYYR